MFDELFDDEFSYLSKIYIKDNKTFFVADQEHISYYINDDSILNRGLLEDYELFYECSRRNIKYINDIYDSPTLYMYHTVIT